MIISEYLFILSKNYKVSIIINEKIVTIFAVLSTKKKKIKFLPVKTRDEVKIFISLLMPPNRKEDFGI